MPTFELAVVACPRYLYAVCICMYTLPNVLAGRFNIYPASRLRPVKQKPAEGCKRLVGTLSFQSDRSAPA